MVNQTTSANKKKILLILALSVIPFIWALFSGGKAGFIKGRVNHGDLITPLITTETADFSGIDLFSQQNLKELKGHWVILNVVSQPSCQQACLDAVYKTKQLRLMLNKDLTRVRRAVLLVADADPGAVNGWFKDDEALLKIKPTRGLLDKIRAIGHGNIPDGMLLLMDPLGNVMMQYPSGFDPYHVKSDLMHLLRVSQIG
jgi:hypothetical protein